jgi:hypothetical protein
VGVNGRAMQGVGQQGPQGACKCVGRFARWGVGGVGGMV